MLSKNMPKTCTQPKVFVLRSTTDFEPAKINNYLSEQKGK